MSHEFHMVNASPKEAEKYKMDEYTKKGGIVVVDPDENEITRDSFLYRMQNETAPGKALEIIKRALALYASKEISWLDSVEKGVEHANAGKKLLFIAFVDGQKSSEKTLKALEDRLLLKTNEKFVFVKLKAVEKPKKPDEAKELSEEEKKKQAEDEEAFERMQKWGVSSAPAIFIVDPEETELEKSPLLRITGAKDTKALKTAMKKALDDYRKIQEKKKQEEEKKKKKEQK